MAELKIVERPILGKPDDIRAILAGTKTQMRVAFPGEPYQHEPEDRRHPDEWWMSDPASRKRTSSIGNARGMRRSDAKGRFDPNEPIQWSYLDKDAWLRRVCPLGAVGDRLWMREAFFDHGEPGTREERIEYRATPWDRDGGSAGGWKPSTNMPRWASRIVLHITKVRVERLQDITAVDAISEGVLGLGDDWIAKHFPEYAADLAQWKRLETTNIKPPLGPGPLQRFKALWGWKWEANPLVWALTFERVAEDGSRK